MKGVITIIICLLGIVGIGALIAYPLWTQTDVTITIDSKERVNQGDSSQYLVWTKEGEVFSNEDYLLLGKFNSSDLYGQLKEGETYDCHVAGVRVQFFSFYRNLISCKAQGE